MSHSNNSTSWQSLVFRFWIHSLSASLLIGIVIIDPVSDFPDRIAVNHQQDLTTAIDDDEVVAERRITGSDLDQS